MIRFLPIVCCLLLPAAAPVAAQSLPAFTVADDGITVSGISSGGFMAVQMHVAFSGRIHGAGVVAGGPYDCADGSLTTALDTCMGDGTPDAPSRIADARAGAAAGAIDDLANLADDRVYLFRGRRDETVGPGVMTALQAFYRAFLPAEAMVVVTEIEAAHSMPTEECCQACATAGAPYMNDCDFDAAGQILGFLYGGLKAKVPQLPQNLLTFDQAAFANVTYGTSLHRKGHVYVPTACRQGQPCRLHVAFHGCQQSEDDIADLFYTRAGYNEWAEANDIIILYPQVKRIGNDYSFWWSLVWDGVYNPRGCWDWWGQYYTGQDYHQRQGKQMQAVIKMVDRLSGR